MNQMIDVLDYNHKIEPKIQEALSPIMGFFKDLSFGYTRFYQNETRIILETNTDWFAAHVEKGLYDTALSECVTRVLSNADNQYVYLMTGEPMTPVHSLLFEHDMWNGLCFYVKSKNYIEAFHLETSRDNNEILNLYVSHPDVFQKMVNFIREKLFDLKIENAPRCLFSIYTPNDLEENYSHNEHNYSIYNEKKLKEFSKTIDVKKVYIPRYNVFLPKRQAACYFLLTKGFTSKEIGHRLGLSSRTVESYIAIIKSKLGIHYKNELIANEYKDSEPQKYS